MNLERKKYSGTVITMMEWHSATQEGHYTWDNQCCIGYHEAVQELINMISWENENLDKVEIFGLEKSRVVSIGPNRVVQVDEDGWEVEEDNSVKIIYDDYVFNSRWITEAK